MPFPKLDEVQGKLKERNDKLAGILKEAGPELDMSKVKSLDGDSQAKVDALRTLNEEIDALGSERDDLLLVQKSAERAAEHEKAGQPDPGAEGGADEQKKRDQGRKSIGELFTESAAFKNRSGRQGPSAELDVDVKALFQTSDGVPPETTRTGKFVDIVQPPLDLLDVIPTTTTQQIAVVYMEETVFNNTAAEVPEAGAYPEAELGAEERSAPVRKIAVFLPMTDEQMEDIAYARSYVNSRLPLMVRQRLNRQILAGNGTAPNLRGLLNTPGIQNVPVGSDSRPDAIHKAITQILMTAQARVNFIGMNPVDWEAIRLLRTTDGIYLWGSPSEAGPARIWGTAVAPVQSLVEGTTVVGDISQAELAVKRGMDVQVSNSHEDYFTHGKQAIRADMRAALVVYRPAAFATVTATTP